MTQHLPVFVYGTLRNPYGTNPQGNYSWALAGRTTSEQTAYLDQAVMYSNGGFPFVTLVGCGRDDRVVGELMYLDPTQYDAVVRDLDGLEGYNGPNQASNMYDRVVVTVTTESGERVEASTYLVAARLFEHRVQYLPRVESGDWFEHITRGRTQRLVDSAY